MIQPISFSEEHIRELQKTSKRDPVLLERAVYAFGLLEALARVGMPFIFKGGTCLMLLMNRPRRLSTDIGLVPTITSHNAHQKFLDIKLQ